MKQLLVALLGDISGQRVGPNFKTLEGGSDTLTRHAGKELTTVHFVIFQRSTDLIFWHHVGFSTY
jgi:hypothetical protein